MRIRYEWDFETVDEHNDIINHDHRDALSSFTEFEMKCHEEDDNRLVLVRDVITTSGSVSDRTWAYIENGELPEHFHDSYDRPHSAVPKRFTKELEEFKKNKKWISKI